MKDNPHAIRNSIYLLLASVICMVAAFTFQEKLSQFRSLGLLGIFLINFFANATIFLPAPGIATVVAGGVLYPPLAVGVVAALGSVAGDMVGFVLGHSGAGVIFRKNHHFWYEIIQNIFKKYGDVAIVLFALVPNPFFDAIGIIAGAFHYNPIRFFVVAFLGRLARNILLALAGSAFAS